MKLLTLAATAAAMTTVAPAAAQVGYYVAVPKAAPTRTSLVTRSTVWKCTDGTCSAPRGGERDTVMCELVVQRAGALASFTAGGGAFGEDALAKCNARAK